MKKVMFVISGLSTGGAERVVTSIASALAEDKIQTSILTYFKDYNEYEFSNKIKRINISGGDINAYNKMSFFKKITLIRKHIKTENPDEIICFLPHPSVLTFFATLLSKYAKRISVAIRANPKMESSKASKLQKKIISFYKRIITQNEGQMSCYPSKLKSKMIVIPNPMYDELFRLEKEYANEPKKIVSVGRLSEQKNYQLAIDAFEIIAKKYPKIEYFIYGNGPLENNLNDLIKEKKLENKIHIMGFEKNREIIYGDKDIFLMTSKFEGMPNALAEAMCMGIPAISTNCDFGPRDLIMNENMGILLKDYKLETLTASLEKIIDNYNYYAWVGRNARNILKKTYGFDKIVNKWKELLK